MVFFVSEYRKKMEMNNRLCLYTHMEIPYFQGNRTECIQNASQAYRLVRKIFLVHL